MLRRCIRAAVSCCFYPSSSSLMRNSVSQILRPINENRACHQFLNQPNSGVPVLLSSLPGVVDFATSSALTPIPRRELSQFASGFSLPTPKKLEEIFNLKSLERLENEDIIQRWNDHHLGRGHISSVLPADSYSTVYNRAQQCPMFVLPIGRPKGFVTMLSQSQMPHLLFTGLEDFKARGPSASPFFTVTHFTELSETKGIVLVRGDVVLPSKLSDDEARALLSNWHTFYINDAHFKSIHNFNKSPTDFDFREVVRHLGLPGW